MRHLGVPRRRPARVDGQQKGMLKRWPVLVALGGVTLLLLSTLGLDLLFARRVGRRTDEIMGNSLRSITLLEDIRTQVTRLIPPDVKQGDLVSATSAIATDGNAYEVLATSPGEAEDWSTLKDKLLHLSTELPRAPEPRAQEAREIFRQINRLVAINLADSRAHLAAIRRVHRQSLVSDAIVGAATLALVVLISLWLIRVLGRQARLVEERVRLLDERAVELESFAGRAAHDLRSPMNPIRGYAELILETDGLPEGVPSMAQRIRRSVDRMSRVVDDMLALSISGRPAAGQCSISGTLARLLEELGPELGAAEVITKVEAGTVACTEGVLTQILRNLVSNAIKFRSRDRPLKIAITARDVGPMVALTIEDNGIGMDPESAAHAFEPFYRGRTDREVPGHGLGLAIVERTTRALGGSCQMTSAPEQGTRITVRLPRPATPSAAGRSSESQLLRAGQFVRQGSTD